jgi:hypothetical protein
MSPSASPFAVTSASGFVPDPWGRGWGYFRVSARVWCHFQERCSDIGIFVDGPRIRVGFTARNSVSAFWASAAA